MTKINPAGITPVIGSRYPEPFRSMSAQRSKRALGDAAGLTDFGVNLTTLEPGEMSSQRHWHSHEDEFVHVISGTLVLIDESGETVLGAGDHAGFPKGVANGHHLVNRSDKPAVFLEIGSRAAADRVTYPDVDMKAEKQARYVFTRKDGSPFA